MGFNSAFKGLNKEYRQIQIFDRHYSIMEYVNIIAFCTLYRYAATFGLPPQIAVKKRVALYRRLTVPAHLTIRGSWPPQSWGFLDHTQRRTTFGRTPLDKWSARRRDLYLITHITHNRQTSMSPVGFEPTISAGERPQTYALDRAATGTGNYSLIMP